MGLNRYQLTFESYGNHYQIYGRNIQDVMMNVYYDQLSEVVYLAKIILEEMEGKDHGESS